MRGNEQQQWKVIYYVSSTGNIPVKEFLDTVKPSIKAKAFRILLTVAEYGLSSIIPHVKKLSGSDLWEIRILGEDNVRILFVTKKEGKILLLHAFIKKTQKTPQREIATALVRLREYELAHKA